MVHSHPSLRRPITEAQFRAEVASVWRQVRVPFLAMVVFSERLQKRHCRNARSYAEVEIREKEVVFYFAYAVLNLPKRNRTALIAHEIGHVLSPGGNEEDADDAAFECLGVSIYYDNRWPGKGLQST